MIKKNIFCVLWLLILSIDLTAHPLKIVCTAALLSLQYDKRMEEYISSIETVKSYGYEVFIVESCSFMPTFLNELSDNVWYSKTNDYSLRNKGVNEVKALLSFFENHSFQEDDIIVKLTGRYLLCDDKFLQCINESLNDDAFIKYIADQVFTGCFAMRYRYFIKFLRQLNLNQMEQRMINLERELARYIESNKQIKIHKFDMLGVQARIAFGEQVHSL